MTSRTGMLLLVVFSLTESPIIAQQGRFHIYQVTRKGVRSAVGYAVDGGYTVGKDSVVVKIDTFTVVAHGRVTLHSLKIGLCSETDGFTTIGDEVFAPEISLKETSLEFKQSYGFSGRTVRIALTEKLPKHNWLCAVLSDSVGDDFAEDAREPTVVRASRWTK